MTTVEQNKDKSNKMNTQVKAKNKSSVKKKRLVSLKKKNKDRKQSLQHIQDVEDGVKPHAKAARERSSKKLAKRTKLQNQMIQALSYLRKWKNNRSVYLK